MNVQKVSSTFQRCERYPRLWGDDASKTQTNQPSKHMPTGIIPCSEESFHWARKVHNGKLCSERVVFSPYYDKSFLSRLNMAVLKSIVISQEFALSTLFLASHRCLVCRTTKDAEDYDCAVCFQDDRLLTSMHILTVTLTIIASSAIVARKRQLYERRHLHRIRSRLLDALLIAGIIRFLSSVLRTLTASYSSDTVTALAIIGMVTHVITADYNYANGVSLKGDVKDTTLVEHGRPLFLGGTISINCVFSSTALLASRLPSDTVSYAFFMWTTIMFAYYPEARYIIAQSNRGYLVSWVVTIGFSFSAIQLLDNRTEGFLFAIVHFFIYVISPIHKSILQGYKQKINGPDRKSVV